MGDTDPLAGIESVDWENLQHAYGSAEDVPDCLRRLLSPDKDVREDTLDELHSNIYHQDTRYTASVAAIPFLYRLLDDPKTPGRDDIIELLVLLAVGTNTPDEPLGADIRDWLKTEAEMRQPGYLAKRKQRLEEWAAAAVGEKKRNSRGFQASDEQEETPSRYFAPFDCYREVQRGLNSMYVCLNDTSPLVRATAAFALAWFPKELETIHERLLSLLERDGDDAVQATTIISLAVVQYMSETNPNQQLIQRLEKEFSSGKAAEIVRWACSLALLKLGTFNKKHISLLTQKLVDETYLDEYESINLKDTAFPFGDCLGSGIALLVAVEFGALKGSDHPDIVRAILAPLSEPYFGIELALPTAALMMVFDGVKPTTSPAFESLSPLQKEVVIAFANVEESDWQFGNLGMVLEEWKLPDTQEEMLRFIKESTV